MATTPVSTPVPVPEAEPQAKISPFARIIGVFFSPTPTFEDIARKPGWLLPLVLTTLFSLVAVTALNQRTNWREYINQQMEKNPRAAQLTAEQKDQQLEISAKVTPIIVYIAGALVPVISALLIGLVMMGAYNLLAGAGASFLQSFSIAAHAGVVNLLGTVLFLLVLFLKPPGTMNIENPLATNLAAFLPEESAKWLVALCKSIDLFTIWTLILLAIGFAAVNPRKLKGAQPFIIAFSVWAVFVLIRTAWAFIFS